MLSEKPLFFALAARAESAFSLRYVLKLFMLFSVLHVSFYNWIIVKFNIVRFMRVPRSTAFWFSYRRLFHFCMFSMKNNCRIMIFTEIMRIIIWVGVTMVASLLEHFRCWMIM